jgi:hypothetical protein
MESTNESGLLWMGPIFRELLKLMRNSYCRTTYRHHIRYVVARVEPYVEDRGDRSYSVTSVLSTPNALSDFSKSCRKTMGSCPGRAERMPGRSDGRSLIASANSPDRGARATAALTKRVPSEPTIASL